MWYAIYEELTGKLKSLGTILPDPIPEGLLCKELAEKPDLKIQVWDTETREFVDKVFTVAEREAQLKAPYAVWRRWKDTLDEAVSRGSYPPEVITKLTNRVENAWSAYEAAILQWYNAP